MERNMHPKPSKSDYQKARNAHKKRPSHAQDVDNAELSQVTPFYNVWITDPSRWDIWGVDTPKKRRND